MNPPTYWGDMRDMPFWLLLSIIIVKNFQTNTRVTDSQKQVTRRRYRTLLQTKRMAEESDARIERLEKESQKSWAQMAKMMELMRALVREKGQTTTNPQDGAFQPEQRREDPAYPQGSAPPYVQT